MHAKSLISAGFVKSTRLGIILGLTVASGLASALVISRPSYAADDDYVRSIRSEGHKLEQLDQRSAAGGESNSKPVKDFEATLLLESPESFRLYQQLPSEKQLAVFQLYQQQRDLKPVRRRIIELRLGE